MDKSYVRQSRLINHLHVVAWILLFSAGAVLSFVAQRRGSNEQPAFLSGYSPAQLSQHLTDGGFDSASEQFASTETPRGAGSYENGEADQVTLDATEEADWYTPEDGGGDTEEAAAADARPHPYRTIPIGSVYEPDEVEFSPTPDESGTADSQGSSRDFDDGNTESTGDSPIVGWRARDERTAEQHESAIAETAQIFAAQPARVEALEPASQAGTSSIELKPNAEVEAGQNGVTEVAEAAPTQAIKLVIQNPARIGYPVAFLYGTELVHLQSGQTFTRTFVSPAERPKVVVFHRGDDFGEAHHQLAPGHYEFHVTREGWNIRPQATKPGKETSAETLKEQP